MSNDDILLLLTGFIGGVAFCTFILVWRLAG